MKYTPRVVTSQDAPQGYAATCHPVRRDYCIPAHLMYPPEINPMADRVFPDPKRRAWKVSPPYNKSFKKVKQLREIKMTDYSVGEIEEKWALARVSRLATKHNAWMFTPFCHQGKAHGLSQIADASLSTRYDDNYDIIRAVDTFPSVEYTDSPTPESISKALIDIKSSVVQASFSGFDALTELAELPETLEMLLTLFKAALRPIQGIKALQEKYKRAKARGKTHTEAHGEIASQWMQYRYGIMPLVYSIQDAIKLLDEGFSEFKTDRAFTVLTSKPRKVPSTETHVAIYRAHEVRISAIAKSKYASYGSRMSDLITTNLFVTAWELIPMSFVIDWFINVGDVIASHTGGLMSLAEERKFCYSIRRSTIDRHYLNYKFTDGSRVVFNDVYSNPCTGAPGFAVYNRTFDNESLNIGSQLLYERIENSYDRQTFTPDSIKFKFEPDLNWMRMLDGYVLSFNQIRKVLKSRR